MSVTTEVQMLIGLIIVVAGSYWTYVIWRIDKSQSRLWDRMDAICKQVDNLQGEHNILHNLKKPKGS